MDKLLLAITTYNQSEYTQKLFNSLSLINDDISIDILVIDDCSTDDTLNFLKEMKNLNKNFDYIEKEYPMGLSHSWNKAYHRFRDFDYKYVIIANNDILIPNGSISELVEVTKKWNFSVICPLSTKYGAGHNSKFQGVDVYYPQHLNLCILPENYQYIQDSIIENKTTLINTNSLYLADPRRMKMYNGFFFMMTRKVIDYELENGNLFDEKKILYKGEDDFNWRALIPNNDFPAVCLTSFIFHFKGMSIKKFKGEHHNEYDNFMWRREIEDNTEYLNGGYKNERVEYHKKIE